MAEIVEGETRKRRLKGEGLANEESKRRRSEGKPYKNNKDVLVHAKEPVFDISCSCKYECRKIPLLENKKLFKEFYALGDNVKQNSYLMGLFAITPVKRRRHGHYNNPEDSRRQTSINFTIPDEKGNKSQVCKNTFMKVFGVTKRRIATLIKAKKAEEALYTEKILVKK